MLHFCRRVCKHVPYPAFCQDFSASARMLNAPPLLAANVYVSEGRDSALLESLSLAAESALPHCSLCHVFQDEKYHRTGFTLAGTVPALTTALLALTARALEEIDLRKHVKVTHPRTGAVDHVVFHPLKGASDLDLAATIAVRLAERLGSECSVPVYLYGASHRDRRPLADLRRALGYFHGAKDGVWSGALSPSVQVPKVSSPQSSSSVHSFPQESASPPVPSPKLPACDYGSSIRFDKSGVVCVGATHWVVNYNVPIVSDDMDNARWIARAVSERGGGLPRVQAMALPHSPGIIEIACNLLEPDLAPPAMVQACVQDKALQKGFRVKQGYSTGVDPESILARVKEQLSSSQAQTSGTVSGS